jgi:hypothetical protein
VTCGSASHIQTIRWRTNTSIRHPTVLEGGGEWERSTIPRESE